MRYTLVQFSTVVALSTSALAQSRVIITEIMYNPASHERKGETEWVEIANVGSEPIEIKDWRLKDEDKGAWGKFSCTLAPGAVAVLINGDAVKEEQFRAAWDAQTESADPAAKPTYQVIPVKWGGLANDPGPDNEVLQLVNDKDEVVCEVKQAGEWPKVKNAGGPSVFLADVTAADLSLGKTWALSTRGQNGARTNKTTEIFDKEDCGSPGFIPTASAVATKPPEAAPQVKAKDDKIDY